MWFLAFNYQPGRKPSFSHPHFTRNINQPYNLILQNLVAIERLMPTTITIVTLVAGVVVVVVVVV